MRYTIAVLLMILLSCNLWSESDASASARTQAQHIPQGAKVSAKLKGGAVVRGRLGPVDQDSFIVSTGRGASRSRSIRFNDVDSVTADPPRKTPVAAWVVAGAVVAAVVIVVAAFAVERHNE